MKSSKSVKKVKKQAVRDPWGARGGKRREVEKARARAKEKAGPAKTEAAPDRRRRAARMEEPTNSHSRKTGSKTGSNARASRKTRNPRRRMTLALLALLALVITGLVLAGPIMRNLDASAKIKTRQAEFEKEQWKTEDLRNRKAQASDMKFLEEEARRIGYVLPGEIPVIVVEEEAKPPEPGQAQPESAPAP